MNKLQQAAYDSFTQAERSVALLGPGGTGKSFVFKKMIQYCVDNNIAHVTSAMTGVAAALVDGKTLHAALGLALDDEEYAIVGRVRHIPRLYDVWTKTSVLFIDEVSMMTGQMLDLLDAVARNVRECSEPMGGMRLVVSGDFLQLGPVTRGACVYAFESEVWDQVFGIEDVFVFDQLIRQQDDVEWGEMLANIRVGIKRPCDMAKLAMRRCPPGIDIDKLVHVYCVNKSVDAINLDKLKSAKKAGAKSAIFESKLVCDQECDESIYKHLTKPNVELCVGARVMHTVNDSAKGVWNGTVGTVIDVEPVFVEFDNGVAARINVVETQTIVKDLGTSFRITRTFMPLKLCWASTVHRVQGLTLDQGFVNLAAAMSPGQVYTALSRFTHLNGVVIGSFNQQRILTCPKCLDFYKRCTRKSRPMSKTQDAAVL